MSDRILTKAERSDMVERKFLLDVQEKLSDSSVLWIRTVKFDTTSDPPGKYVSNNLFVQKIGVPRIKRLLDEYGYTWEEERDYCGHICSECEYGYDLRGRVNITRDQYKQNEESRFCNESTCCEEEECNNGWWLKVTD